MNHEYPPCDCSQCRGFRQGVAGLMIGMIVLALAIAIYSVVKYGPPLPW